MYIYIWFYRKYIVYNFSLICGNIWVFISEINDGYVCNDIFNVKVRKGNWKRREKMVVERRCKRREGRKICL